MRNRLGLQKRMGLYFVTPKVNWVLDWVAYYVTHAVNNQFGLETHVVNSVSGLYGQIIHHGSLWGLASNVSSRQSAQNLIVGTVFHGDKNDTRFSEALSTVLSNHEKLEKLHTASRIMEERLLSWGIPENKLVRIPLGVDLQQFGPGSQEVKLRKRSELGIPENAFVIGSFQKDGVGMKEGNEPKLIKGPDVLLRVVEEVNRIHPVFVLLSGPARGYVKAGLEQMKIPYHHIVFENFLDVPSLYHALDAYLVPSREEGGPQGVLEALASGVPLVSTRVGLAPDVVTNGKNGLLADSEDIDALASNLVQLIEHQELGQRLSRQGLKDVVEYDWPIIAARYYREIYKPILDDFGKLKS